MLPERSKTSTGRAGSPCPTARGVKSAPLRGGPLIVLPRTLEPGIAEALDALDLVGVTPIRLRGRISDMADALWRHLEQAALGPFWLRQWLVDDITFQAGLLGQITNSDEFALRLEAVATDACSKFHADNVVARLVTTYRGPGTEYLSPKLVSKQPEGQPFPESAIERLERGCVAIFRGKLGETPGCPALLHRSPAIAETGIVRLFLAIDPLIDNPGTA